MISIIVPFKNEEKNLTLLYEGIKKSLNKESWELILVNDGSKDMSPQEARKLAKDDKRVVFLSHRRNFGKGRGLTTGFKEAKGEYIVFMDADLQDDPEDLPRFIKKLEEGYDLVNGWRKSRHDSFTKLIPSRIGNLLILKGVLHSSFHDINCGYKILRREILETISLYGNNFRFLPVFAEKEGFRVTEIEVHHHSRKHGVSNYGFFNRFSIFLDILTSYFLYKFREKPLHFFGTIGSIFFALGFIMAIYMTYERIFFGILLYKRPLLLFAALLIIVGIQIIMTGIVAELLVYMRYNSKNDSNHS